MNTDIEYKLQRDPDTDTWWVIVDGDCVIQHKSVEYAQGFLDRLLLSNCEQAKEVYHLALAWKASGFAFEEKRELQLYLEQI